jgi:hypothetical protein
MANEHHANLFGTNSAHWNEWRQQNPSIIPDLSGTNAAGRDLSRFDLSFADFRRAYLRDIQAIGTNLQSARCQDADCASANFKDADLHDADLSGADLSRANFYRSNLEGAILSGANIYRTVFREAVFGETVLADLDLETAVGLCEVKHTRNSTVGTDTLFRSSGTIPDELLRKAGVPPELISYLPSLVEAAQPVQFHSCFFSYSHQDESFARRLWAELREQRIRTWYAPEDVQGGKKIFDQIDRAIQLHDKLLLVLSKDSMSSNWVTTEIRKARRQEAKEKRRKLFPIRLVDFETIKNWTCFDADSGRDIAAEIREYFIPDFSKWGKDGDFDLAFEKLLRDLRAEGVVTTAK